MRWNGPLRRQLQYDGKGSTSQTSVSFWQLPAGSTPKSRKYCAAYSLPERVRSWPHLFPITQFPLTGIPPWLEIDFKNNQKPLIFRTR